MSSLSVSSSTTNPYQPSSQSQGTVQSEFQALGQALQSGNLAEPRVNFPVPMVRRVDAFPKGSGVQDEVVRRAVQAGQPAQDLAERLGGGGDVRIGRPGEVRGMAARHDPDLERRA